MLINIIRSPPGAAFERPSAAEIIDNPAFKFFRHFRNFSTDEAATLIAPVFRDLKHSGRQRGRARQGRLVGERKTMIDREHELPIAKQAAELGISRGSDLVSGDGDVRTFNPPSDTRY